MRASRGGTGTRFQAVAGGGPGYGFRPGARFRPDTRICGLPAGGAGAGVRRLRALHRASAPRRRLRAVESEGTLVRQIQRHELGQEQVYPGDSGQSLRLSLPRLQDHAGDLYPPLSRLASVQRQGPHPRRQRQGGRALGAAGPGTGTCRPFC